jgi:glycosyltransferase involved in cell wall biosynthesis
VVLKIVGKDEGEGEKLRQLVKEFGLDVEFCGVLSEDEKDRAWEWCDVLVLPTLSENFGLVVAEALERGKRVITTDGAPVWNPGDSGQELGVGVGYGGSLLYLKGYRDGSDAKRVELLKKAIHLCLKD